MTSEDWDLVAERVILVLCLACLVAYFCGWLK